MPSSKFKYALTVTKAEAAASFASKVTSNQKRPKMNRYEKDQVLITAIVNSIRGPPVENSEGEAELLKKLSEDYLWKECSTLLKDYFDVDFLNEIKDNKQILFRLYKLYLLHQLVLRIKAIEDNPNHPATKKRTSKSGAHPEPLPLYYEDGSDDDLEGTGQEGQGGDAETNMYRGLDKDEIYKHKMTSFIRLLQDILNPAQLPEARELDSVFQLKAQVRAYYERKGELADNLTETLFAMM